MASFNEVRALSTAILAGCLAAGAVRPQEQPLFCESGAVALQYEGPYGKLGEHSFAASRGSSGVLGFYNNTGKPISRLTVAVDYLARDGQTLLTMLYQAGPRRTEEQLFSFERAAPWPELEEPLRPSASIRLLGESPVTTSRCPTGARVSLLSIVFLDHQTFLWSTPAWRIEATPKSTGKSFTLDPALVRSVSQFSVKVRINPDGRISDLWAAEPVDSDVLGKIKSQIGSWSFEPALRAGKAEEDEQFWLLRFHTQFIKEKDNWQFVVNGAPSSPFTVLDFFSDVGTPGHWAVVYGDQTADLTVR